MAVKASTNAVRVLTVLDAVARHQPIGVSELARLLDDDKSGIQRMLVALAEEGWIRADGSVKTRWSVTQRLRLLADLACGDGDLRTVARPVIEALRDASGETVSLVLADGNRFVVADVAESPALLRAVPRIGMAVPGRLSASALAFLPWLPPARQARLLGGTADEATATCIATAREQGFAIVESPRGGETVSIAAAIRDAAGQPLGALVLSAPQARLDAAQRLALGRQVRDAAAACAAG
ncbi:MAG: helix-turn-helix domain-containing protein [Sphingomonadales bacterium]|nr:helix-turn-helix domain-containing protein [Sphingomonadales bacterium]